MAFFEPHFSRLRTGTRAPRLAAKTGFVRRQLGRGDRTGATARRNMVEVSWGSMSTNPTSEVPCPRVLLRHVLYRRMVVEFYYRGGLVVIFGQFFLLGGTWICQPSPGQGRLVQEVGPSYQVSLHCGLTLPHVMLACGCTGLPRNFERYRALRWREHVYR